MSDEYFIPYWVYPALRKIRNRETNLFVDECQQKTKGSLFAATCPYFPKLVKIGVTTNDVEMHLACINQDAIPTEFTIISSVESENPFKLYHILSESLETHKEVFFNWYLVSQEEIIGKLEQLRNHEIPVHMELTHLRLAPEIEQFSKTVEKLDQKVDTIFDLLMVAQRNK